jgi:hypothetical protein
MQWTARAVGLAGALALLSLTGCANGIDDSSDWKTTREDTNDYQIDSRLIELPDGTSVLCLTYNSYGITCDWKEAE